METLQSIVLSKKGLFSGTAVKTKDRELSYAEFDRLTEQFADVLVSRGVKPGDILIIHMERTIEMVIAMFGILKAGAAMAPIVTSFPEKRFEHVVKSSGARQIIDDRTFEELMSLPGTGKPFKPCMAKGKDPAIVLYTSGSTGVPKGVVQSQSSVGFLFMQFPDRMEPTGIRVKAFDSVLGRLNQGFIVAYHYEYPVALLNGKKLILLSSEEQSSILDTCEYLEAEKNCLMAILPSQLNMFLENERFQKALSGVSVLGFFAEPLSNTLKDRIAELESFTGSFVTVYGQTECFGIGWQDFRGNRGMVPSPQVDIRVLDPEGNTLPLEERGELAVHSPSLFSAYLLDDPEEAAAVYRNKFLQIDGKPYLKTGDMGLITGAGELKLSGRNDRMVKYHGQRIELAEIESVMKNYPGIRNSCALVVKGNNQNDLLVAYYESDFNSEINVRKLREDLLDHIPAYMVPVYFVKLDVLPLNANGKIDYTALKNIPINYDEVRDSRKLSTIEQLIARLASDILKIPVSEFAADSNLMALGMDSLNAVLLINGLAEAGYWLSIEDFITCSTIEEIGAKLRNRSGKTAVKDSERKDVSELVRCTDMQTFWIEHNMQVVANIAGKRGIGEEELKKKIERMSVIHPAFRSTFIENDGKYFTKVLKERPIRYEYIDIRNMGDGTEEISARQRGFIKARFQDLFAHPDLNDLLYVVAYRTAENRTVFSIRFDHRVVDGMGEKVLFQEFLTKEELTEVDHYIEYLELTADPDARNEAKAFWKEYLKGTEVAGLRQNPRSTGRPNFKKYKITVSGEQAGKVREFCRKQNVSVSAYVLYRYARAIMDMVGKDDIVVPVGVSGRSAPIESMDRMIGCIINAVPVRIKREYSERDFMKSYLTADRYGFLQAEEIYSECFGMSKVPSIAPYIVSQIFPENIIKEDYEYFENPSFNLFNLGEFLWEDADGIHLLMHPDIDLYDERTMDRVFMRTKELMQNVSMK